ncbi:hypothetical protein [Citricoccus sp.]|uniref:hypothetical protein n=1 Tax=Citricoccus sp. TaxID=1978372 RepID=UPI0028BF160D|nr:hypothetical protein [Citricoccus sp.]
MANENQQARRKVLRVPVPDAEGIARLVGALAGMTFAFVASLVGTAIYEAWDAEPTWETLGLGIAGIGAERWVLGISAAVFLVARLVERRLRRGADRSVLDGRLLLTQFSKISLRLADGVRLTPARRIAEQRQILTSVLTALIVGCKQVEDARVVFYVLNEDGTELHVEDHVGERPPLGPFKAGTDRGDDALTFVTTMPAGRAELIPDTKKEKRIGWSGSGNGYRTYISTVVGNASGPIGMLSIDAKNPRTLTNADKHYASMAAGLLAIAYTPLR